MNHIRFFFKECKVALQEPTLKQKEAYGRLLHTLCAAAFIALVSIAWAKTEWTPYNVATVVLLMFCVLALFFAGAVLSKGETK